MLLAVLEKLRKPVRSKDLTGLLKRESGNDRLLTHNELKDLIRLLKSNASFLGEVQVVPVDNDEFLIITPRVKRIEEDVLNE